MDVSVCSGIFNLILLPGDAWALECFNNKGLPCDFYLVKT